MCVGEVKCLGAAVWPQIHVLPNLKKDIKKDRGKTKKMERTKNVISRNSGNHTFLRENMQTRISTDQTRGNCYGLDPG